MDTSNTNDKPTEDEEAKQQKANPPPPRSKKDGKKLNKTPVVKKAKLVAKSDHVKRPKRNRELEELWTENKIFCLPLMPTEKDEREVFMQSEFRCHYCDDLGDNDSLQCKVCPKLSHIRCLHRRGHLASQNVPLKIEWTCSECSDLSKILSDDEIRRIINVFEELDFRKACYVKLADYLKIKKRMKQQKGEKMTDEEIKNEERRFRLIDMDDSGTITWNEFIDFETADLLARKNKVELSNHLTIKELISAKKLFLSYDKEKMFMIKREDAKACYLAYIDKLNEKLGAPFLEHIGNCAELFGFETQEEENQTTAKTMWDEFIRKMTILILYDRLNSHHFMPRYWKPGVWYSCKPGNENTRPLSKVSVKIAHNTHATHSPGASEANTHSNASQRAHSTVKSEHPASAHKPSSSLKTRSVPKSSDGPKTSSKVSLVQKNILKMNSEKVENATKKIVYSSLLTDGFDLNQLMSRDMELHKFVPHSQTDFGSYRYVIRSKNIEAKLPTSEPRQLDRISSALADVEKENTHSTSHLASQSMTFQLAGTKAHNRLTKSDDLDIKTRVKSDRPEEKNVPMSSARLNQSSEDAKRELSKNYETESYILSSSVNGSFFSTIEKNKNDLITIQTSGNPQLLGYQAAKKADRVDQKANMNDTNAQNRSTALNQPVQTNYVPIRPAYNFNKVTDEIREYFNIKNKPPQLVAPNRQESRYMPVKIISDESSFIFPEVNDSKSITSKTMSSVTGNKLITLNKFNEKLLLKPNKSFPATNLPKIGRGTKNHENFGVYV